MALIDADQSTSRDRFIIEYASGRSAGEAALAVGASRRTGYRWIKDPDVRLQIDDTRREIRRQTVDLLAALNASAIACLNRVLTDPEVAASVQVRAAALVLSESRNWIEVEDLRQRIELLESGSENDFTRAIRDALSDEEPR